MKTKEREQRTGVGAADRADGLVGAVCPSEKLGDGLVAHVQSLYFLGAALAAGAGALRIDLLSMLTVLPYSV